LAASWPDDYERGRPGWPAEVAEIPGLNADAAVVELGAGTGKLTRVLASKFRRVVALEPAPDMRALLTRASLGVDVVAGSAEEIPLAGRSVEAVFVAEAFHRFNAEPAIAEIARVLAPQGALVLMWNVPAGPAHRPDVASVERLLLEHAPGTREELGYDPVDLNATRFESGEWQVPVAGSPFAEIHERRLPHKQTLDRDGLLAFYASMGWLASMPAEQRESLLAEVESLLTNAKYERSWETRLFWTRLK
jgi:SAM-dependent methyltransferase